MLKSGQQVRRGVWLEERQTAFRKIQQFAKFGAINWIDLARLLLIPKTTYIASGLNPFSFCSDLSTRHITLGASNLAKELISVEG